MPRYKITQHLSGWKIVENFVDAKNEEEANELYNKGDLVENVHFADEKHDYGLSKRKAAYTFFARYLKLDYSSIQDGEGNVDESFIKLLPINELLVFPERLSFHSLR